MEYFIRVVWEDLVCFGLFYGGSERGFYIFFDNGLCW